MVTLMLRSVLTVLIGYTIFALSAVLLFHISGRDPHAPQSLSFEIATVVYGIVFAALGGLVATRIAPRDGVRHAAFVSLLIAVGATLSLIAAPGAGATWTQWTAILLMAPSAWAAGAFSARLGRRQN